MLKFVNLNRFTLYVGDSHKFRGEWFRDGVSITPTSVTVKVVKDDGTVIISDTTGGDTGGLSGNEVIYNYATLPAGNYKLYFITVLSSTETETGVVPFVVKSRGA